MSCLKSIKKNSQSSLEVTLHSEEAPLAILLDASSFITCKNIPDDFNFGLENCAKIKLSEILSVPEYLKNRAV